MSLPLPRLLPFEDQDSAGVVQAVDAGGFVTMGVRGGDTLNSVAVQGTTFPNESGNKNCRFSFQYSL